MERRAEGMWRNGIPRKLCEPNHLMGCKPKSQRLFTKVPLIFTIIALGILLQFFAFISLKDTAS